MWGKTRLPHLTCVHSAENRSCTIWGEAVVLLTGIAKFKSRSFYYHVSLCNIRGITLVCIAGQTILMVLATANTSKDPPVSAWYHHSATESTLVIVKVFIMFITKLVSRPHPHPGQWSASKTDWFSFGSPPPSLRPPPFPPPRTSKHAMPVPTTLIQ
jgi:hypothetical protein